MTRVGLVDVISPNRLGSDKSKWDPNGLSRSDAEEIVNVVFAAIVEALLKGETVDLPIGTFEVQKHTEPTPSGRLMKVEFEPDAWLLIELNKPAARPGRTGPLPIAEEEDQEIQEIPPGGTIEADAEGRQKVDRRPGVPPR